MIECAFSVVQKQQH